MNHPAANLLRMRTWRGKWFIVSDSDGITVPLRSEITWRVVVFSKQMVALTVQTKNIVLAELCILCLKRHKFSSLLLSNILGENVTSPFCQSPPSNFWKHYPQKIWLSCYSLILFVQHATPIKSKEFQISHCENSVLTAITSLSLFSKLPHITQHLFSGNRRKK